MRTQLSVTPYFSVAYLRYYGVLPLASTNGTLQVASVREPNIAALTDLEARYGCNRSEVTRCSEGDFERALADIEAPSSSLLREEDSSDADARDLANQAPVVRYVNLLVREAVERRASDVHVESSAEGLRVRLRVDGVLERVADPPAELGSAVVSRLKILADLNIAERRRPQDGRMRLRIDDQSVDVRCSCVPSSHGESVVLRLLGEAGPGALSDLGLSAAQQKEFRSLIDATDGIVVATGPTGSGKTTTLHCALGIRSTGREKIVTVEDPVEYHVPGVTQVPVHVGAGVTFGSVLRSLLRQDPDIIMVGEVRDSETASIAFQAALTGHLVLTTVHTNDAASAIVRLIDIGVEPYLISAALKGIVAQRLARRLCEKCKQRVDASEALPGVEPSASISVAGTYKAVGCSHCRYRGYRGRTGLFEILTITPPVLALLKSTPDPTALRARARGDGMVTLQEDAWSKVMQGETSAEEIRRVLNWGGRE